MLFEVVDHPRSSVVYNFNHVCMYVMYVCKAFESFDVGSSFLHFWYIWRGYVYMKVIGLSSRSQEQKGKKSLFPQCKTSISDNSGFIKHRAVKFACSMGFSAMTVRVV